MGVIKIKNIYCETVVGAYQSEKGRKQPLVISLKLEYDPGKSGETDNLEDTFNYHLLVDQVKKHIESTEFNLVEKAVEDIGKIALSFEKVKSCKVEAAKTKGPIEYIESFAVIKKFKRKD
jgi:FolB domain-containing protein